MTLKEPGKPSAQPSSANAQGSSLLEAFESHQMALRRFIARYLHDRHDIEDVAQESFLRAYHAGLHTEVLQPKSYLFRIAKNIAVSQLRLKSRQITDYIEDQSSSDSLLSEWTLEDEVMAKQRLGIYCDAVATLPAQCRRVYIMRKVYGMPHKEIADRLGIAVKTVEKHLFKGVRSCDVYVREQYQPNEQGESAKASSTVTPISEGGRTNG